MAKRETVAAIVRLNPFTVEVVLPEPKDEVLETLRAQLSSIALTPSRRGLVVEQFRVAEALHSKKYGNKLAIRRAVPAICEMQERYLSSLDPLDLQDVALHALAVNFGMDDLDLAEEIKGLVIQHPGRSIAIDSLIGPIGPAQGAVGFIKPHFLIPTDEPKDIEQVKCLANIFRQGRHSIFEPVLTVEDPLRPECGLVCDGNHRTAAAFLAKTSVRIRILKSQADLEFLKVGFVAALARHLSFEDFVDRCREQSKSIGLYDKGWKGYLGTLAPRSLDLGSNSHNSAQP